jgi:hypothetical protein
MCQNLNLRFFPFYCLFSSFFLPLFAFLICRFIAFTPFSICFFIAFCFPPSFSLLFYPYFLAHVVSSLPYPNLLGNKRLGCYCCCTVLVLNKEPTDRKRESCTAFHNKHNSLIVSLSKHNIIAPPYKFLRNVKMGRVEFLFLKAIKISRNMEKESVNHAKKLRYSGHDFTV